MHKPDPLLYRSYSEYLAAYERWQRLERASGYWPTTSSTISTTSNAYYTNDNWQFQSVPAQDYNGKVYQVTKQYVMTTSVAEGAAKPKGPLEILDERIREICWNPDELHS